MDSITSAQDFLKTIQINKIVKVKFTKVDGSIREMKCTLDFNLIPKEHQPKNPLNLYAILKQINEKGSLRVYDLDKKDWRTVPITRVDWLEDENNKRFSIKI